MRLNDPVFITELATHGCNYGYGTIEPYPMLLSWNEIRDRALRFSREWADEDPGSSEAKAFWDAFFMVFGVPRRRVASFEEPVKKSDGDGGYIDLLWKGILLVEHRSRGKDLDRAFGQARDFL